MTTNPDTMLKMTFYSYYSKYIAIFFLSIRMHWFTVGDMDLNYQRSLKKIYIWPRPIHFIYTRSSFAGKDLFLFEDYNLKNKFYNWF